jgi:hypothetical protein
VWVSRGSGVSHRLGEVLSRRRWGLDNRVTEGATEVRVVRGTLRDRTEDISLELHLDDCHLLTGRDIVAVGSVHAARLYARSAIIGAKASRETGHALVRYHRYGPRRPRNSSHHPCMPSLQYSAITGLRSPTKW